MVDKLPFLSDDHHYAIAAVATRAAQLDALIENIIASLMPGAPRTSKFILKNMNGDKYVGMLEQMLHDLIPEKASTTERAFARVRALRTERNEILHWLYGKSDDPTLAKYVSMRPHRERAERTKTAQQIQDIANELLDLNLVIGALGYLAMKLRASPDTPLPPTHQLDLAWRQGLDHFEKGEPLRLQPNSLPG